jgi:hypothetical protein
MNNETVWDGEKVTCYVSENGDVFYGVIEVKKYVGNLLPSRGTTVLVKNMTNY